MSKHTTTRRLGAAAFAVEPLEGRALCSTVVPTGTVTFAVGDTTSAVELEPAYVTSYQTGAAATTDDPFFFDLGAELTADRDSAPAAIDDPYFFDLGAELTADRDSAPATDDPLFF